MAANCLGFGEDDMTTARLTSGPLPGASVRPLLHALMAMIARMIEIVDKRMRD
jgi:hypothetical protein